METPARAATSPIVTLRCAMAPTLAPSTTLSITLSITIDTPMPACKARIRGPRQGGHHHDERAAMAVATRRVGVARDRRQRLFELGLEGRRVGLERAREAHLVAQRQQRPGQDLLAEDGR